MGYQHRIQICAGSERHTTERRSAIVKIDGVPIYEKLQSFSAEWILVGHKGRHGKWCIAKYSVPYGTELDFTASANNRETITKKIVVDSQPIDVEGYYYNGEPCGWIVSIGRESKCVEDPPEVLKEALKDWEI